MLGQFGACYSLSRISEGGYVDNPADNGGPTNYGVTQLTYDRYRSREGKPLRNVRFIEQGEVKTIYKVDFWDAAGCDVLPVGVDYAVFDFALNSGPARAVIRLQGLVGAAADGRIGPKTITAVDRYATAHTLRRVVDDYCNDRLSYMQSLHDWPVFGKGWAARVDGVRLEAVRMAVHEG